MPGPRVSEQRRFKFKYGGLDEFYQFTQFGHERTWLGQRLVVGDVPLYDVKCVKCGEEVRALLPATLTISSVMNAY